MHRKTALALAAGSLMVFAPIAPADKPVIVGCTIYTLDDQMDLGYDNGKAKTVSVDKGNKEIAKQGGLPSEGGLDRSCTLIR
jgi:hypothetical protein